MNRRVQVDLALHLTITLDGDPHERTAAYNALLADAVETMERLGRRYYLREERGESITARLPDECDITELTSGTMATRGARRRASKRPSRHAGAGASGARPEATAPASTPDPGRVLRLVGERQSGDHVGSAGRRAAVAPRAA